MSEAAGREQHHTRKYERNVADAAEERETGETQILAFRATNSPNSLLLKEYVLLTSLHIHEAEGYPQKALIDF